MRARKTASIVKNNCKDCPFKSRTVGSRGNPKSRLVIVGESPGSTEVRVGKLFVGPSGQFLDQMLKRVGIEEEPFYTNALSCLPPRGNKDKKDQLINDACRACGFRLIEEISAHPRKLILAMGNAALRSLTGNYSSHITNERGTLMKHNLASVGMLPCFHPAHVLRNEGLYPQSLSDMDKAAKLLRGEIPTDPTYSYKVVRTDKELRSLAIKIKRTGQVVGDIETTGLRRFDDEFMCVGLTPLPLPSHTSKSRIVIYVIETIEILQKLLKMVPTTVEWIWHNGKFDCTFMWAKGISPENIHVDGDTMLLSYALDENTGRHGLERCIMDWLGVAGYKDMLSDYTKIGSEIHKKFNSTIKGLKKGLKRGEELLEGVEGKVWENITYDITKDKAGITDEMREQYARVGYPKKAYALVPKDILYDYLAKDVVYTGWLHDKLSPLVDEDDFLRSLYWDMLVPASNALGKIELNGIPIDQNEVERSEAELNEQIQPVLNNLRRMTGFSDFNPNSQPQVMAALTTGNEGKGIVGRGLGVKKSNADTLEQFSGKDGFVDALLEYRKCQKLLSTYIKPYRVGNGRSLPGLERGRINTSYLIHGTVTGRLSSSGPNIQNWPKLKIIRRISRAPKGRIFVSLDYSQAELRSLAVLSGDEGLLEIFKSGQDLHTAVATKVFGEEFTGLDKSDEKEAFKWKELRRHAKTINFGVVYGVTPPTLAERLSISISEAEELVSGWFSRFPVAEEFMADTRDVKEQSLVTVFGRKRRFHVLTEQNRYGLANEAGNFLHQSMCSDFTLESAIILSDVITKLPGKPKQINIVHDDNIFEIDKSRKAVIKLIKEVSLVMQGVPVSMGIDAIPFTADASIGDTWADLKDIRMDLLDKGKLVAASDD